MVMNTEQQTVWDNAPTIYAGLEYPVDAWYHDGGESECCGARIIDYYRANGGNGYTVSLCSECSNTAEAMAE